MTRKGSLDPRYRANISIGMRVTIKEEESRDLAPCYVRKIITRDAMNELGVMVMCEDGRVGRVQHIGTETAYKPPMDLITDLEAKMRRLIVEELSRDDPDWWDHKVPPKIRERVAAKIGGEYGQDTTTPRHKLIEEIYFSELDLIIRASKKNWAKHFRQIFQDPDMLKVKLSELSHCRNRLAHGREFTEHLKKKVQVYYDDITQLIETHQRRPH